MKTTGSWSKKRRVVAKVEWHPGELYPSVGLDPLCGSSVTNLSRPAERVTWFYNQRGKAEQYIKEGKSAESRFTGEGNHCSTKTVHRGVMRRDHLGREHALNFIGRLDALK